MTIKSKKILKCDGCGEVVTFDFDGYSHDIYFTPIASRGKPWDGWVEVGDHHLCPRCAGAYERKRKEMQAELDDMAGFTHVDITV